jgi:hypothetical protein
VSLETPSGKVLAETRVNGSAVPGDAPGWVSAEFSKPATLRQGERLALVLRSDDANFEIYPIRDGAPYGFGAGTTFSAGYAQFSTGSSWAGWDQWDESNRKDGDLQFALQLAP